MGLSPCLSVLSPTTVGAHCGGLGGPSPGAQHQHSPGWWQTGSPAEYVGDPQSSHCILLPLRGAEVSAGHSGDLRPGCDMGQGGWLPGAEMGL